jgi:hypothetical protein
MKLSKITNIQDTPSQRPATRGWKLWMGTGITLLWILILIFMMVETSNTPTVNQYWRVQSELEQKAGGQADHSPENGRPPAPKSSGLKIPYSKVGDYYKLGFEVLSSFPSEAPMLRAIPKGPLLQEKKPRTKVPNSILALDGQKVSVPGFMIPMAMDKNKVSSFILAQNQQACCYGIMPKLNQWIYVTMGEGRTADSTMDVPITIYGTLQVREGAGPQDGGWCLYRMTADKIEKPDSFWF